jgi:7-cyano-7-deazaguanine reductase
MDQDHVRELRAASPLGKEAAYISKYDPALLFFIPRKIKRKEIGIADVLPFYGVDIWNAFELSWLNQKGKPMAAVLVIEVPAQSNNIFESKSLKLYLTSFNGTKFKDAAEVAVTIKKDLSIAAEADIKVTVTLVQNHLPITTANLPGINIDDLDVVIETYQPETAYLETSVEIVSEELNSHLLKSNCLVTNQPDWGSLYIKYKGPKINREGLLKYIVSLRDHNEFHEQCVERVFMDLLQHCKPENLTVYARYTRRGGIDINPFRSTEAGCDASNDRLIRQ